MDTHLRDTLVRVCFCSDPDHIGSLEERIERELERYLVIARNEIAEGDSDIAIREQRKQLGELEFALKYMVPAIRNLSSDTRTVIRWAFEGEDAQNTDERLFPRYLQVPELRWGVQGAPPITTEAQATQEERDRWSRNKALTIPDLSRLEALLESVRLAIKGLGEQNTSGSRNVSRDARLNLIYNLVVIFWTTLVRQVGDKPGRLFGRTNLTWRALEEQHSARVFATKYGSGSSEAKDARKLARKYDPKTVWKKLISHYRDKRICFTEACLASRAGPQPKVMSEYGEEKAPELAWNLEWAHGMNRQHAFSSRVIADGCRWSWFPNVPQLARERKMPKQRNGWTPPSMGINGMFGIGWNNFPEKYRPPSK